MKEIRIFNYIDEKICDDNIFIDSKLKEVFDKAVEDKSSIMMEYLKWKCSFQEKLDRQELFQIMLTDDGNAAELFEVKKNLVNLTKARECVYSEKDEISSSMWKLLYISRFCGFVNNIEYLSEKLIMGSKSIRRMKEAILEYKGITKNAKNDVDEFYGLVDADYRGTYVVSVRGGDVFGASKVKYHKKDDINEELSNIMSSIFPDMGLKRSEGYRGTEKHRYLSKIVRDNVKLTESLKIILEKYKDILEFDEKILLQDIHIIDGVIAFCRYYENKGIVFSFPEFGKGIDIKNASDISLICQECQIVANDICVGDEKNAVLITGANSGGKTSFMRAIQQVVTLGIAGLPVPADSARIMDVRYVHSFFEDDENHNGFGRFIDEKLRVDMGLSEAKDSMVFINEMFSSTYEARSTDNIVRLINDNEHNLIFVNTHFLDVAEKLEAKTTKYLMTELKDNAPTHKIINGIYGESVTHSILKKYKMTKEDLVAGRIS